MQLKSDDRLAIAYTVGIHVLGCAFHMKADRGRPATTRKVIWTGPEAVGRTDGQRPATSSARGREKEWVKCRWMRCISDSWARCL